VYIIEPQVAKGLTLLGGSKLRPILAVQIKKIGERA
jgi:hypothetical protein